MVWDGLAVIGIISLVAAAVCAAWTLYVVISDVFLD